MIDATLHPVPSGFISALAALPREDQPVLAICLSGYTCSTFELLTARYMPTSRPRSPWRDISGDAVGDSGSDIIGWCEAADWIEREVHEGFAIDFTGRVYEPLLLRAGATAGVNLREEPQ